MAAENDGETLASEDARGTRFRVRAVKLVVTAGPNAGRSARVDRPSYVVGTGESADLRLTDGTVSREHLRLSLSSAGVVVHDEGSKNGTWMGGARIASAMLTLDTILTLGTTKLSLELEHDPLDLPLSESSSFGDAIGVSPAMRHLFAILERAAGSDITVLLEGESGVGKDVLARTIHTRSNRAGRPFVVVDCGSISPSLIESELFGHEKGAFTGAVQSHEGLFEQASGGTVFLDEVAELPLEMQPKLLRVLETREVRPVGGRSPRSVDVRVIAATNRCLSEAAASHEFRPDLFYRLAVARVTVPPLRDRREDIVPLARAFLRTAIGDPGAELPEQLAAMFTSYSWPGNVRELRNAVERYAMLGAKSASALFDRQLTADTSSDLELITQLPYHEARKRALETFDRTYFPKLLERAGGVIARAAELAQVGRPSLYRMLQRLNVERGIAPKPDDE